jgi:hypothetical protein
MSRAGVKEKVKMSWVSPSNPVQRINGRRFPIEMWCFPEKSGARPGAEGGPSFFAHSVSLVPLWGSVYQHVGGIVRVLWDTTSVDGGTKV